jgi:hypothetical protein
MTGLASIMAVLEVALMGRVVCAIQFLADICDHGPSALSSPTCAVRSVSMMMVGHPAPGATAR